MRGGKGRVRLDGWQTLSPKTLLGRTKLAHKPVSFRGFRKKKKKKKKEEEEEKKKKKKKKKKKV